MDRRRNNEPVTYSELREILRPIFERHRETEEAMALYKRMVPLGVVELLPEILADARVRKVLSGVAEGRWKNWQRWGAVIGALYVAVTLIGSLMAILRTTGLLH